MKIALIQFAPWDKFYAAKMEDDKNIKVGNYLVVKVDGGSDLGKVLEIGECKNYSIDGQVPEEVEIERSANDEDLQAYSANLKHKDEVMAYCHEMVKKNELEMKLIDVHFSLDGQKITCAFIADGRVDFRNLVKDLNRHYQKSVRLYQLGVRDEAKLTGDTGACGLSQCCRSHLKKLGNVTSEFAEQQQVAHRGSERLSGMCGRLKCCLAYEKDLYEELADGLPPVGTRVSTKHGKGEVISWHTLKSSVNVRIDPEKAGERAVIVEVPIAEKKK
jgi:cell fate regulator YaaT (PSP1 superfamily)